MEVKDNETIGLKSVIIKYVLLWKIFVIAAVISVIPAILYLTLYPRTYEMMAQIQIEEDNDMANGAFGLGEAAGLMKSFGLGSASAGSVLIEDEVRNLLSVSLLSEMILDLGINVEYTKPFSYFRMYNSPLVVSTDSITNVRLDEEIEFIVDLSGSKIRVTLESDGDGKKKFEFASLPAVINSCHGAFTIDYTPNNDNSIKKLNILYRPATWVAENFVEDFIIEEASKSSNIIELSCTDHEKQRGLDILNTLIRCYNNKVDDLKSIESQNTIVFLDSRIDSVTTSLRQVEADIASYKKQNKLTNIELDAQLYIEQMKELQVKLIELEAQSHVIRIMEEFVKNPDNKYALVPGLLNQDAEGSPIMVYNELLLERTRVIQNSNITNPLVTTLTEQADQLRESVITSILNAQQGVLLTIEDVKKKEREIYNLMGNYPEQEKDYIELRRQQEIFQGVYLILLQKREEAALSGTPLKERARVIEQAYIKSKPVGPRKLYAALGMMLFTLVASVGYIFFKEQYLVLKEEYKRVKEAEN